MPKQPPERPALSRALATFEIFQQRLMAVHAADFTLLDITMAQAKLLYVVSARGQLSMSEIAKQLGVTVSTASGAVDHLVGIGYLARSDDPANRRQVRVSVTTLGSQTLEQLRELSTRQVRMLLVPLSDDDLDLVERAARLMSDSIARASADATTLPSDVPDPTSEVPRSDS